MMRIKKYVKLDIPKLGKVLHNISEAMNWMGRQSDCYLHLLHFQQVGSWAKINYGTINKNKNKN
jgi:hypothetical protein